MTSTTKGRTLPLRSWYLPMIALFGQWALVRLHGAELIPLEVLGAGLILSYLALFVFIAKNFRLLGIRILAIGVVMNFAVMAANGGFMPLSPDALNEIASPEYSSTLEVGQAVPASKDILLEKSDTALWWLSDVAAFPRVLGSMGIAFSPGDVLIALGMMILMLSVLRQVVFDAGGGALAQAAIPAKGSP